MKFCFNVFTSYMKNLDKMISDITTALVSDIPVLTLSSQP